MRTTVYLIRHGKISDEDVRPYHGHTDVPLAESGVFQISRLAGHLKERTASLEALYCSDLERALKSAVIIGDAFGLKPASAESLRERHFGRWEGLTFNEIRERFPEEFQEWMERPDEFSPPGGESARDVQKRVMPSFLELVSRHSEERIAVVAHGGVNRIIICTLLQIPLRNLFTIEQDHGGLSILEFHDDTPVLKALNITAP